MQRRQLVVFAIAATASLGACGPTGGSAPSFIGLDDQVAFVGEELFFEVRASDPELSSLRFEIESAAPGLVGATLEPAGNGTSALFRWTPAAQDVGEWVFDFIVTDGTSRTVESILIEVRATEGDAPVFRQPLGAGTTLDLTESACLNLVVTIEDTDSTNVVVAEEEPKILGAVLTEGETRWTWDWCPSEEQIASGDSFVLTLSADDGEHKTLKHFLIVLRNTDVTNAVDLGGFIINQAGAGCQLALPEPLEVSRGGSVIIARDSTKGAFEAFWGVTLPPETVFINSQDNCPRINGDESYVLRDSAGASVDGPTPVMGEHENLRRIKASLAAGDAASWTIASDSPANADPGVTPADNLEAIYISEISDADGSGNFVFEFIELGVD